MTSVNLESNPRTGTVPTPHRRSRLSSFVVANSLWLALAALVILLAFLSPTFSNPANLQNILMQNSIIGIVALGMLVMMVSGGFDLSVGAAGGAVAVLTAFMSTQFGLIPALLGGLVLGLLVGAINGILIARFNINSFIATFAMASIITGVVFVITSGKPVVGKSQELQSLAYGAVAGIPLLFVIFVVFAILTHLILRYTKLGHWVYSVGANNDASYLSGVPVQAVKVGAFMFGGVSVGVGGILLFGQSSIGQPSGATDWPLNAIAICVIGGVSLAGGIGRVTNVIAAVLLLGVVKNGLNQLGISPYWQPAITGGIILVAVLADQISRRRN